MAECEACYHRPCREAEVVFQSHSIWERTRWGTINTLSVIDSQVDSMEKLPGQRMILLTSAGFLTEPLETDVDGLMDKARHAEVVINSLDARGLHPYATLNMAHAGMAALASGTGRGIFPEQ